MCSTYLIYIHIELNLGRLSSFCFLFTSLLYYFIYSDIPACDTGQSILWLSAAQSNSQLVIDTANGSKYSIQFLYKLLNICNQDYLFPVFTNQNIMDMIQPASPTSDSVPPVARQETILCLRFTEDNIGSFFHEVKKVFGDHSQEYLQSFDILKGLVRDDFIDRPKIFESIDRVQVQFGDHPQVISGFNAFLPSEYKIVGGSRAHDQEEINNMSENTTAMPKSQQPPTARNAICRPADLQDAFGCGRDVRPSMDATDYIMRMKVCCDYVPTAWDQYIEVLSTPIGEVGEEGNSPFKVCVPPYQSKHFRSPMKWSGSKTFHLPPKKRWIVRLSHDIAENIEKVLEPAFLKQIQKFCNDDYKTLETFKQYVFLFKNGTISEKEFVSIVAPIINGRPDLCRAIQEDKECLITKTPVEPLTDLEKGQVGIDYRTCKRFSASYRELPEEFVHPECSGRDRLCTDVLNDTYLSFPSCSRDFQFVKSCVTQFEEFLHKTEDERFECDMVIQTNSHTIRVLEGVHRKISSMLPKEADKYKLDDCLGGSSATIHQNSVRRIYGDNAKEMINELKRHPIVAVPLVLKRLKAKDREWRNALNSFNKIWCEENEKYCFGYENLDDI